MTTELQHMKKNWNVSCLLSKTEKRSVLDLTYTIFHNNCGWFFFKRLLWKKRNDKYSSKSAIKNHALNSLEWIFKNRSQKNTPLVVLSRSVRVKMIWTNADSATENFALTVNYFWSFSWFEQVRSLQLTSLSKLLLSRHYLMLSEWHDDSCIKV